MLPPSSVDASENYGALTTSPRAPRRAPLARRVKARIPPLSSRTWVRRQHRLDAGSVSGPLLWGDRSGSETNALANAATCVGGSSASKCELGGLGTVEAITPADVCTIYLKDSGAECAADPGRGPPG